MGTDNLDLFGDTPAEVIEEPVVDKEVKSSGDDIVLPPINLDGTAAEGEEFHVLKDFTFVSYMRYGLSVILERAIPHASDGLKPVQRRILYSMHELGMNFGTAFKKSARVVGDVLGRFHPHGDAPAYEAMVRMAQEFSLRYPLIEGQGNFGTLDGDKAAAMRYTEARLSKYAELVLSEVGAGTVDFVPNYDETEQEPSDLPARLPMLMLNGSSGVAVGMATECFPHNMREISAAAIEILTNKIATDDDILNHIQGPDFPGGGQVVSSAEEVRAVYQAGRGSLRVRAVWEIEQQARGQWRMVIKQLPPDVSVKRILEQLGEASDPQIKAGKKELTPQQKNLKALTLEMIENMRDESGKDAALQISLEPRSSRITPDQFIGFLLANTDMEVSVSMNLTTIDLEGKPDQRTVVDTLKVWTRFRFVTVTRRCQTRLAKVVDRLHILEGRMIAFLNIDKVIKVIRESDEPKPALIAAFNLTEIQATDILEIRLRQLARLEGIRIEQEMKELKAEEESLNHLLSNEGAMRKLIVSEINADTKKFGDERRTLMEPSVRVSLAAPTMPDEPCTIILSKNGFIKQRNSHDDDTSTLSFKEGDSLLSIQKTRTRNPVVLIDSMGRAYTVANKDIPGGRTDGVPLASLLDIPAKVKIVGLCAGVPDSRYLFSSTEGYGFVATLKYLVSKQKGGKTFINLPDDAKILPPVLVGTHTLIASLSSTGKMLLFPLAEMKELSGGKGVIVMGLNDNEIMLAVALLSEGDALTVSGKGRGGKEHTQNIDWKALEPQVFKRAKKGSALALKFEPTSLFRCQPTAA